MADEEAADLRDDASASNLAVDDDMPVGAVRRRMERQVLLAVGIARRGTRHDHGRENERMVGVWMKE
jgi:hypothetical protein